MQSALGSAAVFAFFTSLVTCLALLYSRSWHESLTMDSSSGVQKFHTGSTLRVGGVAIFAGLAMTLAVAPASTRSLMLPMLVSSVPAFGAGLLEDLTKKIGVRERLGATIASGVLAWGLTGAVLQRTDLPVLDSLLAFTPFAVLFTAFCVGGMANAVNIIDGFNGLASGVVILMFSALGFIASQVGDADLARVCFLMTACVIGFLVVNWPLGKIFLGDGGAYLLGFLVALAAVLLVVRNPQVSPWAPLVVCAYPVLEVAFSIYRKSRRKGCSPGQPDGIHLHMLVHRRIVKARLTGWRAYLQNSMTSPFAWLFAGMTAAWGALFARDPAVLIAGFGLAAFSYSRVYTRIAKFRWWPAPPKRHLLDAALQPNLMAMSRVRPVTARNEVAARSLRGQAAMAPQLSVACSRGARWLYILLGLSTCIAFIEPSPFEVLGVVVLLIYAGNVMQSSWWRVSGSLTATMLLVLSLFVLLQLVPIAFQAHSTASSAFYAGVTTFLIMIAVHLGRLHGTNDARFSAFLAGYACAALLSALLALATLHPATALLPDLLQLGSRPKAFFKDPNVLGPYLIPACVVFLEMAGRARGARTVLFILCASVCAAGVIASGSRGAWANLAIVLAIYGVLSSRRQLATLSLLAVFAAVPVAAFLVGDSTSEILHLYGSRTQLQSYDSDRFAMAQEAVELGLRYPVGVGPGEVAAHLSLRMDPHNTYARIWAENGPVSLILLLVFLLLLLTHVLQECIGRSLHPSFICAFSLLVGALVNAAVVDTLHWRHFWIIVAVCMFSFNPRRQPAERRAGPLRVHA